MASEVADGPVADSSAEHAEQAVGSERGALVAVLVMVVLGVAGIFAVSA